MTHLEKTRYAAVSKHIHTREDLRRGIELNSIEIFRLPINNDKNNRFPWSVAGSSGRGRSYKLSPPGTSKSGFSFVVPGKHCAFSV